MKIHQQQLVIVLKNWTFHTPAYVEFCENISVWWLKKVQFQQEASLTVRSIFALLGGRMIKFSQEKSYFWMKLIFILVDTLISKIAVFGAQKTRTWSFNLVVTLINEIAVFGAQKNHTWSYLSQCTHYEWLFGATCGSEASLDYISIWKRSNHYGQWRHLSQHDTFIIFVYPLFMVFMWTTFGFKRIIDLLGQMLFG